jgi:hypothetical protein
MHTLRQIGWMVSFAAIVGTASFARAGDAAGRASPRKVALVELFTSQG